MADVAKHAVMYTEHRNSYMEGVPYEQDASFYNISVSYDIKNGTNFILEQASLSIIFAGLVGDRQDFR